MRALVICFGLALACAACATVRPAPTADQASGRAFAERACAGCHAVDEAGASRNPHAPAFRDLARRASDAEIARALATISRQGHVEMPPIYTTPEEQRQLVLYLRRLAGTRA